MPPQNIMECWGSKRKGDEGEGERTGGWGKKKEIEEEPGSGRGPGEGREGGRGRRNPEVL